MNALGLLRLAFEGRFLAVTISAVCVVVFVVLALVLPAWRGVFLVLALVAAALVAVGAYDLSQAKHSILRNYPVLGHLRFFFEKIRPEMRQYFFEDDKDGRPFSRDKRAIVYQRAKRALDKRPFGTVLDSYDPDFEWLNHSMAPAEVNHEPFRVIVGEARSKRPYASSVLNISGMSFGAISPNAIRAMNKGAKMGHFAQVTGEGAVSPYHREHGGDLVWQIASGYFGCRNEDGSFSPARFRDVAQADQIKMIEVKLSQGAKPGHGGVLPKAKITPEIAATRGVGMDRDVVSPAAHSAFRTPVELMHWVAELREMSGGKPVGLKFCVGHRWQVLSLCKAMIETGEGPDYIAVDGSEGGTGAAPLEFADHVGMPLRDALHFVHNALVGTGLRDKVRVVASGKIASAFDIVRAIALGADICHAARAFMFATGCIQAQSCHTGHCPTGVATTDPKRWRALVVEDKAERVANYHRLTLEALAETIAAAGLTHPGQIDPRFLWKRTDPQNAATFQDLYPGLKPGELIDGTDHALFRLPWGRAQADSFQPTHL